MENNISIVPAKHDIALLQNKVGIQLKDLSESISKGQDEIKYTLDELGSSNIDIRIKRHWYGSIDKDSVVKSLENVYSNLGGYIVKCGEAIRNTNDNLVRTIDLIKLLAIVEKDLYEQIDDQNVSSNELKSILLDWFKQQGIKDEDVKELLETSFQRAYTLRDRINVLRHECNTKISQALERISILEEKLEKCEELHGIQRNAEESFCQLAKEKESILDSKKQNLEKCMDEFKHEFKEEKKSLRKMWFWMILSCVSISSIISYVIVTLCK